MAPCGSGRGLCTASVRAAHRTRAAPTAHLSLAQKPRPQPQTLGPRSYVYTEGKPPMERLQAILDNRFRG